MRFLRLSYLVAVSVSAFGADLSNCACDPASPATMAARECGLCREAEKATGDIFFLKDINPRKPNRMLALPKFHSKGGHGLEDLTPEQRTELWTAAIAKAKETWGDDWALAYNGEKVRTQCHTHIHIGKLIQGLETDRVTTVPGPASIPLPGADGMWIHPVPGGLHVHNGEQITESVLLR